MLRRSPRTGCASARRAWRRCAGARRRAAVAALSALRLLLPSPAAAHKKALSREGSGLATASDLLAGFFTWPQAGRLKSPRVSYFYRRPAFFVKRRKSSSLLRQSAFMPMGQQPAREPGQRGEDRDAGQRQQQQRGEHARDLEPIARLEDARGEAGLGAAGAGDELRHHRADQRQAAADAHADEEIRQRRGQQQIAQRLPARGAVKPEQLDQVTV